MALQPVGVQLVADDADTYMRTIAAADAATTKLGTSASGSAAAINKGAGAYVDASGRVRDASGTFQKAGDDIAGASEKGGKGLSILGNIATGAARQVGGLLVDQLANAGQAMVAFAVDGVKKAGDFESKMNEFGAVTGDALSDSGKSLEDFSQLFIQLGRDLPVSTAEVQQAAIEMAKGGIEPATIAAGGLRTALNLAGASGVGIAQSAEILSKQLGVWVDQAASAGEKSQFLALSADLLSQAANASTVNVDDLALGLANSGKSADLAGLSYRETVTSMALISAGFSSAADAGTSFKTFVDKLQPSTDSAAQAMKSLNLLTNEGKSVFYDASGSFIGMEQAAGILHGALDGLSDAQKESTLRVIFGQDAVRAAGMLADAGADGYRHMAEEMAKVGSVAAQAAKRQVGFNVAVDNLMGSIEALQITAARGLLPILTKLIGVLASGVNVVTDYVDATLKGETVLSAIASTINTLAVPALAALTAGSIAYGVTALAPMLVNIPAMTAVLIYNTGAVIANAAAMAAAVAPYVLIAAAIGGVVLAYQSFHEKVTTATEALLNSRPWWVASTAAVEDYATQTGAARDALAPYAATISELRTEIQGEIEDLGQRSAAGLVSEQQYTSEMAAINAKRAGLIEVTGAYEAERQALINEQAASMTATDAAKVHTSALAAVGSQASLTAGDIEEIGKALAKTYQEGQTAIQNYASTQSTFLFEVEARQDEHATKIAELEAKKQAATTEEQKKGIDEQIAQVNQSYVDQETAAATSYARQQAQQQQHLGQMLIDYTVAQAQLGNISKEKAAEITGALETEYGLQESSVASTFLKMAGSIDSFASDSSGSIDGLIGTLRDQQQQAADTQHAMDAYAKEYESTAVSNFLEEKGSAMDYIHALESIPKEVHTRVVTEYVETGNSGGRRAGGELDDSGNTEGRASGGPVSAGQPYLVGERGPELIVPASDATVIPADDTRRALTTPGQLAASFGGGSTTIDNSRTVNMPVYTDQTAGAITQSAAIAWSLL